MMIDERGLMLFTLALAAIGGAIAFALFAFRIVPLWAVPVAAFAAPLAVFALIGAGLVVSTVIEAVRRP